VGSRHDLRSGTSTGTAQTASDGTFYDGHSICSTTCPGSTGEPDGSQSWTVNGIPLFHSNSVIYKCTSIMIDGYCHESPYPGSRGDPIPDNALRSRHCRSGRFRYFCNLVRGFFLSYRSTSIPTNFVVECKKKSPGVAEMWSCPLPLGWQDTIQMCSTFCDTFRSAKECMTF
jgi:hypothetical protein